MAYLYLEPYDALFSNSFARQLSTCGIVALNAFMCVSWQKDHHFLNAVLYWHQEGSVKKAIAMFSDSSDIPFIVNACQIMFRPPG